eukprot:6186059-Pleurochrysis_carterae.AAC.3
MQAIRNSHVQLLVLSWKSQRDPGALLPGACACRRPKTARRRTKMNYGAAPIRAWWRASWRGGPGARAAPPTRRGARRGSPAHAAARSRADRAPRARRALRSPRRTR